jgi:hypothetical protein
MSQRRRSYAPPRWLKPLNIAFLLLRRLGGMSALYVLTVPGRSTGRPRAPPVTVVTVDRDRCLLEGFPGADWARYVRAAGGFAELSIGSRTEHVHLKEVAPPDAIAVLRQWPLRAAAGARIMRDAGVVDDVTPDAFAALAGNSTLFQARTLSTIRHTDRKEST